MSELLSVVQLANGVVVELPGDTPTFDVPAGFDPARGAALGERAWRVLSRRGAAEVFLVRGASEGPGAPAAKWLLSVREPAVSA